MKTIRIFFKLCEMNFKKLLAYRMGFWISLALMSVWVAAYVILVEVIFYHTSTLAGWNKGQVLVILSFYYFVQNISDIFFKDNFEDFGETVRRGELDFKLVKPVPSRLLAFFWEMRFDHAAGLLVTCAMFFYGFKNLTEPLSIRFVMLGFLISLASVLVYFSILSIIGTLAFWVHRNDTFNTLIFNLTQFAKYPRQMYGGIFGKILTFGIPLAALASVPAEVALSFDSGPVPVYFVLLSVALYFVSSFMWNQGIKRYTSAN